MRWLFLFVLSLNLAYIGLEISRSSSADYADVPPLKNVETIVLLSELKARPDVAEEVLVDDVSVKDLPVRQVGVEPEAEGVVQAAAEPVNEESAVSEQSVEKMQGEAVKTPQGVVETAAPIAEKTVLDEPAGAEQESPPVLEHAVPVQSASCFTLGPFRDLGKLRGLIREIKSYVVTADFRGREQKEAALYWVYLKPEKSRALAIKTGKRLKAKKIKDFYVIREGEKINGLSLGHFRNKKSAYRLAEKVKKRGFDVVVEPVFRTRTIYWLDYQLAAGTAIPESVFEKYTRASKKEKITRLSRDCAS